ncbi:MAG TPA: sulfotransferase [Gaiellales bacterium]|nr:sulfotransferase [Gaiellales bacterium]
MPPSDRPIFVLGCPRSGTTLFRTMLSAHRSIAIPPETRYLMGMYWRRSQLGDLRQRETRAELASAIVDDPETRFRVLGVDAEQIRSEIIDGPPTLGSAFGIVFRGYARRFDKPRWGDKRPAYYAFMDELDHLFPDAQFIHLIRDPRACVESLKRQEWYPDEAAPCVAAWVHAVRSASRSGRKLGPKRYLEVRYEDLVSDPETVSRSICDFLDEPFDEQMCRPELIADKVNPAHYQQRRQIQEGVNTASVEAWATRLPADEIALVDRVARRWMQRFGYAPSPAAGKAHPLQIARAVRLHTGYGRRLTGRRLVDARRIAYAEHSVASQLTEEQLRLAAIPHEPTAGEKVMRAVRPVVGPPTRPVRKAVKYVRWRVRRRRRAAAADSPAS